MLHVLQFSRLPEHRGGSAHVIHGFLQKVLHFEGPLQYSHIQTHLYAPRPSSCTLRVGSLSHPRLRRAATKPAFGGASAQAVTRSGASVGISRLPVTPRSPDCLSPAPFNDGIPRKRHSQTENKFFSPTQSSRPSSVDTCELLLHRLATPPFQHITVGPFWMLLGHLWLPIVLLSRCSSLLQWRHYHAGTDENIRSWSEKKKGVLPDCASPSTWHIGAAWLEPAQEYDIVSRDSRVCSESPHRT